MKVNKEELPLIDLLPKVKRPLSLWNPLDYLRILFWFLFFPQAIGFYLEKYEKSIERYKLIFQAYIINLIITFGICAILKPFHFQIHWLYKATEIILIVWFYVALGVAVGVVRYAVRCVSIGVAIGVATGVALGVAVGGIEDIAPGVVFVIACSLAYWVNKDAAGKLKSESGRGYLDVVYGGLGGDVLSSESEIIAGSMIGSMFGGIPVVLSFSGTKGSRVINIVSWLAFISTNILAPFHPVEYMITIIYLAFFPGWEKINRLPQMGRLVFLPIPGIQRDLETRLAVDWEKGIYQANKLLTYSLQFVPVVKAIKHQLDQSPGEILLFRISALTNNIYDWKLFLAISQKRVKFFWKPIFTPPLDTYANAACAGFWYWHKKEPFNAKEAFALVSNLRHGTELYQIALAINRGIKASDLQSIAFLEKEMNCLNALPDPELRTGTIRALRLLHAAADEAQIAGHSQSPFIRSTAVREAVENLTRLIDTGESFCPEPEWPLIRDIALKWRVIFNRTMEAIGKELLRTPTLNPYEGYSRLPVTGSTFSGRSGVIRQIENYWNSGGLTPVIVLYGHRGMGKTSILRSLAKKKYTDNIYVYLDMQIIGWVSHSGQVLLDVAEAVHKSLSQYGFDIGPVPDSTLYSDLNTAICSFNLLLDRIAPNMTEIKRLILAIDEFELIDKGIHEGKFNTGLLLYLRSINQQYQWLGLIFAGLHTLEEMGGDYWYAFRDQAQYLRVSYLTRDDTLKLITQPHPDFLLKYQTALIDEIYRLTYGQPYLVQLLCWELVNRWNERFLAKGESIPRVLTAGDLEPVLIPAFYQAAGYYFDGVWGNATKNEQDLMRILAQFPNPIAKQEIETVAPKAGFLRDPNIMRETLKLLFQHDIITEDETGFRFASELMRRWVDMQG